RVVGDFGNPARTGPAEDRRDHRPGARPQKGHRAIPPLAGRWAPSPDQARGHRRWRGPRSGRAWSVRSRAVTEKPPDLDLLLVVGSGLQRHAFQPAIARHTKQLVEHVPVKPP